LESTAELVGSLS